jgi:predicted small lipoprotein YifL
MNLSPPRWIALSALALALGACGNKGDLVLPEKPDAAQPAKVKSAPAKPAVEKSEAAKPEPH